MNDLIDDLSLISRFVIAEMCLRKVNALVFGEPYNSVAPTESYTHLQSDRGRFQRASSVSKSWSARSLGAASRAVVCGRRCRVGPVD